jgi:Protein of unknown function (DUF2721)
MDTSQVTAIQVIQAMLAPGLGISAVGLLLLGLSSRYSTIVNRIRLLNDEKRRYMKTLAEERVLEYADNVRYMSVRNQTEGLMMRSRLVRNAILSMQTAIALFVVTSLGIGISLFTHSEFVRDGSLVVFLTAMVAVLIGIIYAGMEVRRSYRIVLLEVRSDE